MRLGWTEVEVVPNLFKLRRHVAKKEWWGKDDGSEEETGSEASGGGSVLDQL